MPQELTLRALEAALGWRRPAAELLHRADRGSQYAARAYRRALREHGITVSMSRKGDCWDNAPMESFNGTLKVECVHAQRYATREQARAAIVEYIGCYNTERIHSSLGYVTPAEFERPGIPLSTGQRRMAYTSNAPICRLHSTRTSVADDPSASRVRCAGLRPPLTPPRRPIPWMR